MREGRMRWRWSTPSLGLGPGQAGEGTGRGGGEGSRGPATTSRDAGWWKHMQTAAPQAQAKRPTPPGPTEWVHT